MRHPAMSRLDAHLRRIVAQRDAIDLAARWLAGRDGIVLEFGLGSGRTYSHLVERFPRHEIVCFDAQVIEHPPPRPAPGRLVVGELPGVLATPGLAARFAGRVILAHLDLGGFGGPTPVPGQVMACVHAWLAPGAVVLSDQELPLDPAWGLERDPAAGRVEDRARYFVYRRRPRPAEAGPARGAGRAVGRGRPRRPQPARAGAVSARARSAGRRSGS
jgi:hypothetical protein